MANNITKSLVTSMGEATVTEAKIRTKDGKEYVAYTIRIPKKIMQMLYSLINFVPQAVEIYVTADGKLLLVPKPTMTRKRAKRQKND